MLVWQKIADHTTLRSIDDVANWLTKNEIKACELENVVGYVGNGIECVGDCTQCLANYLDIELDTHEFIEITNEFGDKQLGFGEKFYKRRGT